MTQLINSCVGCKYFVSIDYWVCAAFDERIPYDIRKGINKHKQPFPGDNGIQFEPIDTEKPDDINPRS